MHQPVLLIGTGLTMMDTALELDRRGCSGPLLAISRRGLTPQAHRELPAMPHPAPPAELFSAQASIRHYLRTVRRAAAEATSHGHDWRDTIGALRPVTAALWHALPEAERRRFLRHLQPYWDTHRHRTAPASAARFDILKARGHLQTQAGRLLELQPTEAGIEVCWQTRGQTHRERFHVGAVINCTGPESRLSRLSDPLIRNLLSQGLLASDGLELGVATDAQGALLNRDGHPSDLIYYTGPLLRARDWECTAVPELRVAAMNLADYLVQTW